MAVNLRPTIIGRKLCSSGGYRYRIGEEGGQSNNKYERLELALCQTLGAVIGALALDKQMMQTKESEKYHGNLRRLHWCQPKIATVASRTSSSSV